MIPADPTHDPQTTPTPTETAEHGLAVGPDASVPVSRAQGADGTTPEPPLTDEQITAALTTIEALESSFACNSRDWGKYRDDAWHYGIVLGWTGDCGLVEDDALPELAKRFGWGEESVTRLRQLRAGWEALPRLVAALRSAREENAALHAWTDGVDGVLSAALGDRYNPACPPVDGVRQLVELLGEAQLEAATAIEAGDEATRLADVRRDRIDELTKDAHDAAEELRMAWAERDQLADEVALLRQQASARRTADRCLNCGCAPHPGRCGVCGIDCAQFRADAPVAPSDVTAASILDCACGHAYADHWARPLLDGNYACQCRRTGCDCQQYRTAAEVQVAADAPAASEPDSRAAHFRQCVTCGGVAEWWTDETGQVSRWRHRDQAASYAVGAHRPTFDEAPEVKP